MSVTIEVSCEQHPNYKGKREPTTDKDCVCQLVYILLNEHWRLTGFAKNNTLRVIRKD